MKKDKDMEPRALKLFMSDDHDARTVTGKSFVLAHDEDEAAVLLMGELAAHGLNHDGFTVSEVSDKPCVVVFTG